VEEVFLQKWQTKGKEDEKMGEVEYERKMKRKIEIET
jgi:hypothetical protein